MKDTETKETILISQFPAYLLKEQFLRMLFNKGCEVLLPQEKSASIITLEIIVPKAVDAETLRTEISQYQLRADFGESL